MQKPTPIIQTVTITMEQVLLGATIPLDIERWIIENGNKIFENETVYVTIPKGVDDNEIIILINFILGVSLLEPTTHPRYSFLYTTAYTLGSFSAIQ